MIELLRADRSAVAVNNDWGGTAQLAALFNEVGAFALAEPSKDAEIVARLPPGSYTVKVTGAAATSGVALIEIYEVP
jgi:hypothetical protein